MTSTAGAASDPLRTLVERMSLALHGRGWPRMAARVYVALLCDEREQLTARQLTSLLGVSPAAISAAVNHLTETGLIVRDPIPGSRQEHYRLGSGGILGAVMRKQEASPNLADLAEEGVAVLGPGSPGAERLGELAEFVRFIDDELRGISERWKARQAARP